MEWIKAEVQTTAIGEEIVTGALLENNIAGVEIVNARERVRHLAEVAHTWDYAEEGLLDVESDAVYVVFYVTNDSSGEKLLSDVRESLFHLKIQEIEGFPLGTLEIKLESANDKSWLDEWKKHFKPFSIGRIVIVPQWEEYQSTFGADEIIFKIDPGSAFGTGQHQTTKLCIHALQELLLDDKNVLDIGCGSGILSIISLLLGARDVFACDIDPAGAIAATKKNAALNGINLQNLIIRYGDVLSDEMLRTEIFRNKYDVIVANIVADVIIEIIPFVKEVLEQRGIFIASGIIDERADEVLGVFAKYEIEIVDKFELEGWFCIVGTDEKT
ncbi:MAG: 50S ribosomal protein L11 methyltransferase [Defluviitaleaceae bacterium]|nr:50S ribosomal protein L11 methyltransferase [Defluviitaleaceae bacterium]